MSVDQEQTVKALQSPYIYGNFGASVPRPMTKNWVTQLIGEHGKVLASSSGVRVEFELAKYQSAYVRAKVTWGNHPHTFSAWCQPHFR